MSDSNNSNTNNGIGFFGVLFLVFLVLKLGVGKTVVMGWSWWWVTAPLWGGLALFISVVVIVFLVALIIEVLGKIK